MTVWGITDGTAGATMQVKALAKALGVEPVMKKVLIRKPYIWLPNACYSGALQKRLPRFIDAYKSDALTPPWPETVISCGRRGALAALSLKAQGAPARLIHIHDPQMKAENFDVVVAMEHDRIEGENVIKTKSALHAITPETLAAAATQFTKRFAPYPKPYAAVLLGGSTNKYTLKEEGMREIIRALQQLSNTIAGSLLITVSRRTGSENLKLLLDAFPRSRDSRIYIYDGIGENPYLGMLALAEHIVVTNDSVNMMSEAAATGKPVYILKFPGHENTKPARFAEKLIESGIARLLGGTLEKWSYAAGDDTVRVAENIKRLLAA